MEKIKCPKCKTELEIKKDQKSIVCPQCGKDIAIVRTEKELADALKEEKNYIIIEGDLGKKAIKIKATGKIGWAIAIAAIAVAVAATIAAIPTGGTSEIVGLGAASGAIAILGLDVTITAILIGVAAGGVAVLNKLRGYKIVIKDANRVVLKRT